VELDPLPAIVHPYERCNLWLLQSALACGVDRVRFITLWNGGGGDDPGGIRGLISVEIFARQEKELRRQLRQPDFPDCDPDDGIQLGECWRDTLYDRLRLSIAVIVIGSEAHACSQWCLVELGIASLHARA
jgi:hypothetical protein